MPFARRKQEVAMPVPEPPRPEPTEDDRRTAQRLRSILDVFRRAGRELSLDDFPHLEAVAAGRDDIGKIRVALERGCAPERLRDIFT